MHLKNENNPLRFNKREGKGREAEQQEEEKGRGEEGNGGERHCYIISPLLSVSLLLL